MNSQYSTRHLYLWRKPPLAGWDILAQFECETRAHSSASEYVTIVWKLGNWKVVFRWRFCVPDSYSKCKYSTGSYVTFYYTGFFFNSTYAQEKLSESNQCPLFV
jgi:hypothetical protein